MKYFEVFYPDGNKGIFGFTSNTYNRMQYPVTSLKDAMGNTINYAYTFADNNYDIKKISYNGSSVDFECINRPDTIISFVGGMKVCKTKLLRSITPYFNNKALRVYQLDYTVSNSRSFLSRIDCLAGGESFNPLLFYYGSGNTDKSYTYHWDEEHFFSCFNRTIGQWKEDLYREFADRDAFMERIKRNAALPKVAALNEAHIIYDLAPDSKFLRPAPRRGSIADFISRIFKRK